MGANAAFSPGQRGPREAGLFGDLSDSHGLLPQHGAHLVELIARVARLVADRGHPALRV